MKHLTKRAFSALLFALCVNLSAAAAPISDLVVFGDSLSDTNTRITNDGWMWPEYLAAALGITYNQERNFAVVGATTQDMLGQFQTWTNTSAFDPDALYVVWGGGNNLFEWYNYNNGADTNSLGNVVQSAVADLLSITGALTGMGAHHVALLNLPDLGRTPAFNSSGTAQLATAISQSFNSALAGSLVDSGQPVTLVDVFGGMQAIWDDPAAFGLTNVVSSCSGDNATPNCTGYLFYDETHPTTAGHALVADLIEATVVPVPAALWLFASGIGLFGLLIRRHR